MNTAFGAPPSSSTAGTTAQGLVAPTGTKLADVTLLATPEIRQIVTVVPRGALALDPATAGSRPVDFRGA